MRDLDHSSLPFIAVVLVALLIPMLFSLLALLT